MLRFLLTLFCSTALLCAEDRLVVDDAAYMDTCTRAAEQLFNAGKLVAYKTLRSQLDRRQTALALPEARKEKLPATEVYRLVRESSVSVGSFFKCTRCKNWHFESSSGFVAADGVVSTCQHVVDIKDPRMKEGYLVVADAAGHVYAVSEVLATNPAADTCLLRVPGLPLKPLPLNPAAAVGERVYCLGHPDGNHWMFTEGMLARYFINREAPDTGKAVAPALYINVTAEYSPGSSGAPIVDECGNVVGQVESITTSLEEERAGKNKTITSSFGMPLRMCVSAEEIAKLATPAR